MCWAISEIKRRSRCRGSAVAFLAVAVVFGSCVDRATEEIQGQNAGPRVGYLTVASPTTLLSANDGERLPFDNGPVRDDSITVVHLGPDHPPIVRTAFGIAPSTIIGSPHITMTEDGRYGFVTNHSWRPSGFDTKSRPIVAEHLENVLSAIDLTGEVPALIARVGLDDIPMMVDLHPDGDKVIVSVGASFRVYALHNDSLELVETSMVSRTVWSFDVSPTGDVVLAVLRDPRDTTWLPELHTFEIEGTTIRHANEIETSDVPGLDRGLFSPRIAPDGSRALVLNDWGTGGKGTLDAIWVVELEREVPAVTSRIEQVCDGLESLAFHPGGRMAVVTCLEVGPVNAISSSHLAVIDLDGEAPRVVAYYDVESIPEGIEFTADGTKLFVGTTLSHQIVVFGVDGLHLERSPYVIRTGPSPASLAIASRFPKQ